MGKHTSVVARGSVAKAASPRDRKRPIRTPWKQTLAAFVATFGILLVMIIDPYAGAYASATAAPNHWAVVNGQTFTAAGTYSLAVSRDSYSSKAKPKPTVTATAATATASATSGAPDAPIPTPGSAKAIALSILTSKGMGQDQYSCLVSLWDRESGWSVTAANASGAYGIPQALPGSKMASAGPNWQTNAKTQILWGLSYIQGRYGSPCAAWSHSQSSGWY